MGGNKDGSTVWLGYPLPAYTPSPEELSDAYLSKLGGTPVWVYPDCAAVRAGRTVACGSCGGRAGLVAQVHAPLGQFYRVLYVFACRDKEACLMRREGWTVVRAQTVDDEAPEATAAATHADPAAPEAAASDSESEDGGFGAGGFSDDDDDADAGAFGAKVVAAETDAAATLEAATAPRFSGEVVQKVLWEGCRGGPADEAEVAAAAAKLVPLDICEEPDEASSAVGQEIQRYREKYANNARAAGEGLSTEGSASVPEDYEKAAGERQRAFMKYVKRVQRAPRQAVRWDFGGKPLNPTGKAHEAPPACENCGAKRVPEMQVLSNALAGVQMRERVDLAGMKDDSEATFAVATVYSCSGTCFAGENYVKEYVVVDEEPSFE